MKKIEAIVQEYVDAVNITNKSKFADPNSQREKVDGKIPVPPAATAAPAARCDRTSKTTSSASEAQW